MNYLFIHQNFPGQFLHLAMYLAKQKENRVVFISQESENRIEGVETYFYTPFRPVTPKIHHYIGELEQAIIWGQSVHETCRGLKSEGFRPDIVVGHPGWGETLFVKDVWPDVPVLAYFEFYYHSDGVDVGFDPDIAPKTLDDAPRLRIKNATNLLAFQASDWGFTATEWQASLYPPEMRQKITVVHEGVDTDFASPAVTDAMVVGCPDTLRQSDEIITFVARNLEPYRGFHVFMRALPEIQRRRPKARVIIVGGDDVSYGARPPDGLTFRELLMKEVGGVLDMSRIHFVGQIPHEQFITMLRLSTVHIYLSFPFVLSWSLIEALSCGCLVIASRVPSVMEAIEDGKNGLLVDFFDREALCDKIDLALDHRDHMRPLREAARNTVLKHYDLKAVTLPRQLALIDAVIKRQLPPALDGPRGKKPAKRPARKKAAKA